MSGGPLVRPIRPGERRLCARLAVAVARATYVWQPPGTVTEAAFLEEAEGDALFLAELAGKPVGLLAFYAPENFVHTLSVLPAFQGRGVGRALLTHAQSIATGPLSLKVEVPNVRAIAFYRHLGWRPAHGPDAQGLSPAGIPWVRYCHTLGTPSA